MTKSVLVVEDDWDLRDSLAAVLEGEGYTVFQAENGRKALDFLLGLKSENEYPSCILLDLMMPVMSGDEFLKIIRSKHAQTLAKIPVVVATAAGHSHALSVLPPDVLQIKKPMELNDLLTTLDQKCSPQNEGSS